MMLPRAAALSEVQWSPAAAKDWESFRVRIQAAPAVYAILGYNFRPLDF
jgi:hexosaminidase